MYLRRLHARKRASQHPCSALRRPFPFALPWDQGA
jgi:hypothetical protein